MKSNDVIVIFVSDIHLQSKVPPLRYNEENWYAAMARPLKVLRDMADATHAPVVCAGDIFTRWNSSPELINFALENLPDGMYAIPGQHDLPEHSVDEISRSAFWTLVMCGKIKPIGKCTCIRENPTVWATGFAYGDDVEKFPSSDPACNVFHIAVAHEYVWIPGHQFDVADKSKNLRSVISRAHEGKWLGYDAVVFGDNHNGFITKVYNTPVINCGALMRRHSNEIDYKPFFGMMYENGTIEKYYLPQGGEKVMPLAKTEEAEAHELNTENLFEEMKSLSNKAYDFGVAIQRFLDREQICPETADILHAAIEESYKPEVSE